MVRSLSEAPRYASVISDILGNRVPAEYMLGNSQNYSPSMLGKHFSGIYSSWLVRFYCVKVQTSKRNYYNMMFQHGEHCGLKRGNANDPSSFSD